MSDTIAAIATPVGEGGVSVIRLSGNNSLAIASRMFHPSGKIGESIATPQHAYFGTIHDPATRECIDEVLLVYFRSPKSYTREDVVEISAHGGMFVTSRILQLILAQGARLAEPGEFTRRAFLNGRLDLSQAEAVADLIHASSERALKSALAQLQGKLSIKLNSFYDRLIALLAQLEVAIDFPDEGFNVQSKPHVLEQIRKIHAELDALIRTYRQGKIYREGAKVALAGKPNVGKSSLLNALLDEDRAIVTPYPGTTRDVLEEKIRIKDVHINIIDSAGLRSDPDPIEKAGIARTRAALAHADLALILFDGSQPLDTDDAILIGELKGQPALLVINKSDLPPAWDTAVLVEKFPGTETIRISAKNHTGLDRLIDAVYSRITEDGALQEAVAITRERHRELLVKANNALLKTIESLEQHLSEEFIAADINYALEHLGSIIGKTFEADLLDKIFSEFCIGK